MTAPPVPSYSRTSSYNVCHVTENHANWLASEVEAHYFALVKPSHVKICLRQGFAVDPWYCWDPVYCLLMQSVYNILAASASTQPTDSTHFIDALVSLRFSMSLLCRYGALYADEKTLVLFFVFFLHLRIFFKCFPQPSDPRVLAWVVSFYIFY